MKNEYEIRGEVTAIIINSPKYGRQEALISTSKLERVNKFTGTWCVAKFKKSLYVFGNIPIGNGKQRVTYLHRLLTNAPDGMVVDHINHKPLDNTDSNLRIVTHAQNQQNKIVVSKSGVRGVSWHKRDKKWQVKLQVNRLYKWIGSFDTVEEAERAVSEARAKYMPHSVETTA